MNKKALNKINTFLENTPQGTSTVILATVIALTYLVLSRNFLFIPNKELMIYGFDLVNPLGAITYSFIHLSPQHVVSNIALLIAVGVIAEKKLKLKEYFLIFFISAITAGITFHLLTPKPTILVGASSAVSGILAASVFIDIKKAVPAILIFGLFISIVSPAITTHTKKSLGIMENKTKEVTEEYNETQEKIEGYEKNITNTTSRISILKSKCLEENNETACEKWKELNSTLQEKKQEEKELLEEKKEKIKELSETLTQEQTIKQGIEREEQAKTSAIVHLVGAFTGIAYLFIFRRDIIWSLPSQALQLENYFRK